MKSSKQITKSNILVCLILFVFTFGLYSLYWLRSNTRKIAETTPGSSTIYRLIGFGFVIFSLLFSIYIFNLFSPIDENWIKTLWTLLVLTYGLAYFASCFTYYWLLSRQLALDGNQGFNLLFVFLFHIVFICWFQNRNTDKLNTKFREA